MGKAKGGGKQGGGKEAAVPKCACEDPYKCVCGNRPERPSRGHKWDPTTQQWGGKGHTQKGGSGQTRVVAQEAKTTSLGQTQVAQWQRLPSQLLEEFCQKQRRPPPKFKELMGQNNKYKCRCIVPDPKDPNKDLILLPAAPVGNEEQAKEEAALLALLQVTPNIPHERKLPEPYRTTWLAAVDTQKEAAKKNSGGAKPKHPSTSSGSNPSMVDDVSGPLSSASSQKANANTNLALGISHVSAADRRKDQEERRKLRNARIRRHENIRMANRDHPVFLSAKLRQQIQRLLQGNVNPAEEENDDDDDDDDNALELAQFSSDQQQYIEERLHVEGFTKRQARKAFEQLPASHRVGGSGIDDEEAQWENTYDECLQWLCVHLPEDQLPEGFDPRGSTLEIVRPTTSSKSGSPEVETLANRFGLLSSDAAWVLTRSKALNKPFETVFWERILELANVTYESCDGLDSPTTLQEEKEALEAIFPEGLKVKTKGTIETIELPTPDDLILTIVLDKESYPSTFPQLVLCSGSWLKAGAGVAFHVEVAKCLSTMTSGEPMIFEIFNHVQVLQQSIEDLTEILLLSARSDSVGAPNTSATLVRPTSASDKASKRPKATISPRRPRERGVFWSRHPSKTPAANGCSVVGPSLERQRRSLPAFKAREDFLAALREANNGSRVVLVTGATGSGKTTQIPQFILGELDALLCCCSRSIAKVRGTRDDSGRYYYQLCCVALRDRLLLTPLLSTLEDAPETSKIVVAQPRRLAATGVAARVAEERGESKPGVGSVGYTVRGDSAVGANTRILFCTYGILLRQLQSEGALDCITHVIIDEVHERNLDGDVLMALLKELLVTTPHLRVVLMSATLDADRFSSYWGSNTPRMHIPGRTFPVEDYFLEDVLVLTGYNPPKKRKKKLFTGGSQRPQRQRKSTPWNDSELSDDDEEEMEDAEHPNNSVLGENQMQAKNVEVPLEERVRRVDETQIDYDLLGYLVKSLVRENAMGSDGSILVFLPGAPEINQAKVTLGKMAGGMSLLLLPLHGGLQPKEQNFVFRPSQNAVKVILSTNVAETSITIPDCTVVIDCCREKQSSYDPVNRMPLLVEVFASQASIKQRRGRAGRVREGKCYKLISKLTHAKLHEHTAPEITRCALDQTLLSLLFLGVETGNGAFLQTLLDPPAQESVDAACLSLSKIGAVEKVERDHIRLTALGMHLACIPAPPMVGKMLVMGSILGCRRAALAMAAGISTGRSPFLRVDTPRGGKAEESIQQQKDRIILDTRAKLFEQSGNSDHAMLAVAFMDWEGLPTGGGEKMKYCEKFGLSFNAMRDMLQLVNQYDSALSSAGYGKSAESDRNTSSWRILRTCAISAMSPGQLVRVQRPSTKYASTAEGAREKDGVAKELSFYIRGQGPEDGEGRGKEERVFIHPSSALFTVGNFSCPWLVYNSIVKTSKPFLRDATECSAYALLLFGGTLDVEARNSVISIDGWVKLSANARIGALIRGLRGKMDNLLAEKIKDPKIDISDTSEMRLIVNLLLTDGMGS